MLCTIATKGFTIRDALITPKACMESATCCGMELQRSCVWNQFAELYGIKPTRYTQMRDAMHVFDVIPYRRFATDAMPSRRLG